jgi:hypothetical protein
MLGDMYVNHGARTGRGCTDPKPQRPVSCGIGASCVPDAEASTGHMRMRDGAHMNDDSRADTGPRLTGYRRAGEQLHRAVLELAATRGMSGRGSANGEEA